MNAIFRVVRAGDPARYFQLNHPRLPKGIGYFANIGFDPKARGRASTTASISTGSRSTTATTASGPSASTRCSATTGRCSTSAGATPRRAAATRTASSFTGPGYPRTMVTVDPDATTDDDARPVDPLAVVANIKRATPP